MFKRVLVLAMLGLPTVGAAQGVQVSTFADNETNRTFSQSVTGTNARTQLTGSAGNMLAWDSLGNYNLQFARVETIRYAADRSYFTAGVGAERLYASTSGERYQPTGFVGLGLGPVWTVRSPFSVGVVARYAAFDDIGQYIRTDITTTSITFTGEDYIHQQLVLTGLVDWTGMSDNNDRTTVNVSAQYRTTSGWFYGTRAYVRYYRFDAEPAYWSPKQYGQLVAQGGFRTRWDAPLWRGSATASIGAQQQDYTTANLLWNVSGEVARRVGRVWVKGWGGYNNGNAIAGATQGYRSWTFGLGVSTQ